MLDPDKKHPMVLPDGTVIEQVVHLKTVINHPRIQVGAFSYYHDFQIRDDYATLIAPYLYPQSPEKLVIGKFVQIAHGVRFVTSSANHAMNGFSTYPFQNFMMSPQTSPEDIEAMFHISPDKGDTVIGNDVWIGTEALIMPGVHVGDGTIIGARSVVAHDVAPYTIVVGNPACEVRKRFDDDVISTLQDVRWWDHPIDKIERHKDVLQGSDIEALRRAFG